MRFADVGHKRPGAGGRTRASAGAGAGAGAGPGLHVRAAGRRGGGVETHVQREGPHEELDGEGRCLVWLIEAGLGRRLRWRLRVGLGHKKELMGSGALEGDAALRVVP